MNETQTINMTKMATINNGLCNIASLKMSCVNIYSVHVVLMADSVQLLLRLLCVDLSLDEFPTFVSGESRWGHSCSSSEPVRMTGKGRSSFCRILALNKEAVTDFFQMMASLVLHLLSTCSFPLYLFGFRALSSFVFVWRGVVCY